MRSVAVTAVLLAAAVALLVAPGAAGAEQEPLEAETHSCTIAAGIAGAYADGSDRGVPANVAGCRLAHVEHLSRVLALTVPASCRVMTDLNLDRVQETEVTEGTELSHGTEVWARCDTGAVDAVTSITFVPLRDDPLHSLAEIRPFAATAADGTALRGHVYLPEGPGPFATILEFSPYWNTEYGHSEAQEDLVNGRRTMRGWHQPFLDAGFAVALVNVRGTGESDGCVEWGSPVEWADANTVIDALAAQPWSNGKVGMYGLSYPGWTQWMALAGGPSDNLAAVMPSSAVIDYYDLVTRNGARLLSGSVTYPTWLAGGAFGAFAAFGPTVTGSAYAPDTGPSHVTCPSYAEGLAVNARMTADGERGPWFDLRDLRERLEGATVPAFMAGGLGFQDGSMTQIDGMWDRLAGPRRMILGQWGHDLPARADFPDLAVGWFDHYLRGAERTVKPGEVEYQDSDGDWHTARSWPPNDDELTLHLSNGTLAAGPDTLEASALSFQSSGASWAGLCGSPDHVRYVSEPLAAEDVELAGYFSLRLTLSSTLPEGNLAAYLYAADGDGACGGSQVQVARAMTTLRHWADPGHGSDFPTDRATTITFDSVPFAATVHAGQRLVLDLGGDASEILPDAWKPRVTVHTGPGIVADLTLPVVSK